MVEISNKKFEKYEVLIMVNRLLFLFILLLLLTIIGCADSSVVMEQEQEQEQKENIEVLKQELERLERELIQVKSERDELARQLEENVKTNEAFNLRQMEAYRVQLLFSPPMNLPMYYSITPHPDIKDGWYLIKQPSTIRLIGYENAKSVEFLYTVIGTDMAPQTLEEDINSSDGWEFKWISLPEGTEGIAFWAEVMWADGNVKRFPIMPIEHDTSNE
jgi:cell division protein FtsB